MSATAPAPTAGSPAPSPAPAATAAGGPRGSVWAWLAMAAAVLVAWTALTWPLAANPDQFWTMKGNARVAAEPNFVSRPGTLSGGDHLQNLFIQSVVLDNLRALRDPFLDGREGAAGPAPLRTTSLDLPWTLLLGLVWPLAGLVPAYNLSLALSSLATGLAAFGWLRRHTRWPLLAGAGALAYACTPPRMFQLTSHFNALMWWAFPAALWAFEAMLERQRAGRRWRGPAVSLVAVVLTVAVSGEYHLILYLAGLLTFLAAWALLAGLASRRRVPLGPALVAAGAVAAGSAYVLLAFQHVFKGAVAGENGSWQQVALYAPASAWALVTKSFGTQGEGMVYVGWPLLVLAALGVVAAVAWRRAALPYAVLVVPLVVLTYGPRADVGSFRPYRFLFDHFPFLSLQRVPERLMVVTALVLVVLAVTALDAAAALLGGRGARRLAAAALVVATVLLLADYRVSDNRLRPGLAGNPVVAAMRDAGDRAGPVLGVPVLVPSATWNSATTYLAAQSRRRALNAYNQTPAPWLEERLTRLDPLNHGQADPAALDILRQTGTRQVVVIDEPRVFAAGEWQATVDALVASGRFRLVLEAAPLALLELQA
ncbi:MAG TPA: hypothetical protein VFD04_03640 [Actinomycetes bacterium]|nr:hypothetical protein [Actinomycetes bacterium]